MHQSLLAALTAATLLDSALAFPQIATEVLATAGTSDVLVQRDAATTFNATEQYVSTSGVHKFVAPKAGDQRGPCPGLNALANHGYLPHNGIGTIEQFISSTYKGFGMGKDLGGFLAVYGAIYDGDLTAYSIGFASPQLPVISSLLGTPQGLGGSHNNYENDASPMRGDLYTYGNSFLTQVSQFEQFYNYQSGVPDDQVNFDLDIITQFRHARFDHSIATNPYFFNGPFSGALASPAAYSFIYRFMANKSAEYPEGRLDRNTLKTFYSITGEPGNFSYTPGYERFPENWYKRALSSPYSIRFFGGDLLDQARAHPEFFDFGGNTGKVNTFTGFTPENITGGILNGATLFQGNNLACYLFQFSQAAAPSLLSGVYSDVTPAMNLLGQAFVNATNKLGCPTLFNLQYNQSTFEKLFPGYGKNYKGYKAPKLL